MENIESRILSLQTNPENFEEIALEIFQFQAGQNPVYKQFLRLIERSSKQVTRLVDIPFLPIVFFKTQTIKTGKWDSQSHFQSSGTSGSIRSIHHIRSIDWYHSVSLKIFKNQVGNPADFYLIGLLPTYLENPHSSLISMVSHFGEQTGSEVEFCGLEPQKLQLALKRGRNSGKKILLFSVTYALIHFAEVGGFDFSDHIVVETGGMKGLKKEMSKLEILEILKENLNVSELVSEYGMTEMQSQAYSDQGWYQPGFCMKALVRDLDDPTGKSKYIGRGALNLVDLANWSTCSFLASDDLGEVQKNGLFSISGRAESSDVRGCNLLFN
jgi:hypothetical protein